MHPHLTCVGSVLRRFFVARFLCSTWPAPHLTMLCMPGTIQQYLPVPPPLAALSPFSSIPFHPNPNPILLLTSLSYSMFVAATKAFADTSARVDCAARTISNSASCSLSLCAPFAWIALSRVGGALQENSEFVFNSVREQHKNVNFYRLVSAEKSIQHLIV